MVETISPVVHGGRNASYRRAVALHAFGATLSAALTGAVLGTLGTLAGAPWGDAGLYVLATVALLYAVRELGAVPIPLPDLDRQVPEWWRTFYSTDIAALLYGLGLGVGFLTFLSFGTFVVVAVAAFVSGSPVGGAVALVPFGTLRGLSVLAVRGPDASRLLDVLARPSTRRRAAIVNGLASAAIGAMALTLV